MKKLIILALSFFTVTVFGQTEIKKEIKKEVKIENTDGKYTVTVVTTEDGQTKTMTKSYDSLEEMKNDPDMGDMQILSLGGQGQNAFFFSDDSEGDNKDIKVIIRSGDGDELNEESHQNFVFKSTEGGTAVTHEIKVWVDENGKKHILKDGVEIDGDSWTSEDGTTYDLKKLNGKVMFLSEDEVNEMTFGTDENIDVKVKIDGEAGEEGKEMIIIKTRRNDADAEGENLQEIVVKVIEEIKVHLEDVEEFEFNDVPGIDAKVLKLEELNYFPNPNSGKFTLAFQSTKKPTEIRITGIDGKEVYSENLDSFEGSYNREIDLSGQKPGVYLLQILQGKKAINKKIVIE